MHNDFVLYRYLMFFWKKKWLFLIVPILLGLAAGIYSMTNDKPFVGTANVYAGDIKKVSLRNATLVSSGYAPEKMPANGSFKAATPVANQVLLTVTGSKKAEVENTLKDVQTKYLNDLKVAYEDLYAFQEQHVTKLDERIATLEKSLETYKSHLATTESDAYIDLVINAEEELSGYMEKRIEAKEKLSLAEEPQIISSKVIQTDGNLKANVIVAVVLGLFLTFLGLILWRYILDARKNENV